MKPGDLVHLVPDEDDGLVGLIIAEEDVVLPRPFGQKVRYFRLMVNGNSGWRMPEDRLELIDT